MCFNLFYVDRLKVKIELYILGLISRVLICIKEKDEIRDWITIELTFVTL